MKAYMVVDKDNRGYQKDGTIAICDHIDPAVWLKKLIGEPGLKIIEVDINFVQEL